MSKILGAAEEWGYISENVAQKTKLPATAAWARASRPHSGLSSQTSLPILNEPARSVALLLMLTGLRVARS